MSLYNLDCELCPLHKNGEHVCIPGKSISKNPKVMVIAEAPGYYEDKRGLPLQGKAGQLVQKLFIDNGISLRDLFITHLVKCLPQEGIPPKAKQVKACKVYLEKEITKVQPQYIMTLGALTCKTLTGMKISESHGRVKTIEGIHYFPTFSAGMALRDPKKTIIIERDIEKFARLLQGKPIEEEVNLNYTVIQTYKDFENCIRFIRRTKSLSFDIETTGLNRFEEKINLFSIGNERKQWLLPLEYIHSKYKNNYSLRLKMLKLVMDVCEGKITIAQGGKFDNGFLHYHYGVRINLTDDTMLMSHLIDENTPNALKYNVINVLHGKDYDIPEEDKKGLNFKEPKKYYNYAAYDIYYTALLKKKQYKDLDRDVALPSLYNELVMPVARAYEISETTGVYLNLDKMSSVEKDLLRGIKRLERGLATLTKTKNINWGSPQQVAKVLYENLGLEAAGKTPTGQPSTSEENLKKIRTKHKAVSLLLMHRKKSKLYNGFIKSWNLKRRGNYIYPSWLVSGTGTGRPSCSEPNLQQVPRDSSIRSLVSAPPGWVFFEVDYSQIELRLVALSAQEYTMLEIYHNNGDIHTSTAQAVLQIMEVSADDRFKAKAINFGFIYGMQWKGFRDYAFNDYDLILTDRQSREYRERYFEKYSRLIPWQEKQKMIVRKLGQIRTLTGRVRRLPEIYSSDWGLKSSAERMGINSPIQGFAAELTCMSFAEVTETSNPKRLKTIGTIHDAIVGIVRKECYMEEMTKVKNIMESPKILKKLNITLDIPIIADVKIGDWGSGVKVDFN